jgi:hypothetical protein
MPRRFSIIIVHRNGAAMLLKALAARKAACETTRNRIFTIDRGGHNGSSGLVTTAFPRAQLIRNLLP